jgi:hypothetical protein
MNIYRLDPIDPGLPSWNYSIEKDTLWSSAPTPKEARDLAASKAGFAADAPVGVISPWLDEKATSCVAEPTMTYPDPGEVIREDGSSVNP